MSYHNHMTTNVRLVLIINTENSKTISSNKSIL